MIIYLKYLEDNLNDKYLKEFDEYQKYLKMFYFENSKCPIDSKTLIIKKETKDEIQMWCKTKISKEWKVIIKKPNVINLNIKLNEINDLYKNKSLFFKKYLRENLQSPVYNPDKDKEIEVNLRELKKYEEEIELIRDVFNKQNEEMLILNNKRQEKLKELLELKIKKKNTFLLCSNISGDIRNNLIKIAKNEENISDNRYSQIAQANKIEIGDAKNWIIYYKYNIDYVKKNIDLNEINMNILNLKDKYNIINSNYIITPPEFELSKK